MTSVKNGLNIIYKIMLIVPASQNQHTLHEGLCLCQLHQHALKRERVEGKRNSEEEEEERKDKKRVIII